MGWGQAGFAIPPRATSATGLTHSTVWNPGSATGDEGEEGSTLSDWFRHSAVSDESKDAGPAGVPAIPLQATKVGRRGTGSGSAGVRSWGNWGLVLCDGRWFGTWGGGGPKVRLPPSLRRPAVKLPPPWVGAPNSAEAMTGRPHLSGEMAEYAREQSCHLGVEPVVIRGHPSGEDCGGLIRGEGSRGNCHEDLPRPRIPGHEPRDGIEPAVRCGDCRRLSSPGVRWGGEEGARDALVHMASSSPTVGPAAVQLRVAQSDGAMTACRMPVGGAYLGGRAPGVAPAVGEMEGVVGLPSRNVGSRAGEIGPAPWIQLPEGPGQGRGSEVTCKGSGTSLGSIIEDEEAQRPPLLTWPQWQVWRRDLGFRSPRPRGVGEPFLLREGALYCQSMARFYGATWREQLWLQEYGVALQDTPPGPQGNESGDEIVQGATKGLTAAAAAQSRAGWPSVPGIARGTGEVSPGTGGAGGDNVTPGGRRGHELGNEVSPHEPTWITTAGALGAETEESRGGQVVGEGHPAVAEMKARYLHAMEQMGALEVFEYLRQQLAEVEGTQGPEGPFWRGLLTTLLAERTAEFEGRLFPSSGRPSGESSGVAPWGPGGVCGGRAQCGPGAGPERRLRAGPGGVEFPVLPKGGTRSNLWNLE